MTPLQIQPITAEQTHPLRLSVLRPGQSPQAAVFPNDEVPHAFHFGAFSGKALIGIASIYPEPMPGEADPTAWRLRGMAVAPECQRRGVGRALLEACLAHVDFEGGTRLWCNARSTARGFYASLGFGTQGEEFDIEGVGPHFVMCYNISRGDRPC